MLNDGDAIASLRIITIIIDETAGTEKQPYLISNLGYFLNFTTAYNC